MKFGKLVLIEGLCVQLLPPEALNTDNSCRNHPETQGRGITLDLTFPSLIKSRNVRLNLQFLNTICSTKNRITNTFRNHMTFRNMVVLIKRFFLFNCLIKVFEFVSITFFNIIFWVVTLKCYIFSFLMHNSSITLLNSLKRIAS